MGKQSNPNIDYQLLERLIAIRKSTGLNQEAFFDKHLRKIKELASSNSKQEYMSNLENGKTPITPDILSAYSKAANCSIDSIINGKEFESAKNELSYNDLCKMLIELDTSFDVTMEIDRKYENYFDKYSVLLEIKPSGNKNERYFTFKSVCEFVKKYKMLKELCTDKIDTKHTDEIYKTMINSYLSQVPNITKTDNTFCE